MLILELIYQFRDTVVSRAKYKRREMRVRDDRVSLRESTSSETSIVSNLKNG